MPCLNEADTLARCIRKARAAIERLGLNAEVVIADNGSTDGSPRIAREEGARVVEVPVRGYGAALYFGILGAAGSYIIMGDADDSYDFSNIDAFVTELRRGHRLLAPPSEPNEADEEAEEHDLTAEAHARDAGALPCSEPIAIFANGWATKKCPTLNKH
jgi:glycosyltransferase involved in cell wall biosynthesis